MGDRSAAIAAHGRIPTVIDALRRRDGVPLDPYWIPTPDAARPAVLDGFDGIWIVPGSPYRCEAGALAAARVARTRGIPFLGTCGGFSTPSSNTPGPSAELPTAPTRRWTPAHRLR